MKTYRVTRRILNYGNVDADRESFDFLGADYEEKVPVTLGFQDEYPTKVVGWAFLKEGVGGIDAEMELTVDPSHLSPAMGGRSLEKKKIGDTWLHTFYQIKEIGLCVARNVDPYITPIQPGEVTMTEKLDIHPVFTVHRLTPEGLQEAEKLAYKFSVLLQELEASFSASREMSIVRTKLQEAAFFAKRALAEKPEFQATGPIK